MLILGLICASFKNTVLRSEVTASVFFPGCWAKTVDNFPVLHTPCGKLVDNSQINSGVVPQQPPRMHAPASKKSAVWAQNSSGDMW